MGNLKLKVLLYILSLWLLFSLFIMSWDSDFLSKAYSHILEMGFSFSLYEKLKTRNYVFLLSLLFMFIGFWVLVIFILKLQPVGALL